MLYRVKKLKKQKYPPRIEKAAMQAILSKSQGIIMTEKSKSLLNLIIVAAGPFFLCFAATELHQLLILVPSMVVIICIGLPVFHLMKSEKKAFLVTAFAAFFSSLLCLTAMGMCSDSKDVRENLPELVISTGISIFPSFLSLTWLLLLAKRKRDRNLARAQIKPS